MTELYKAGIIEVTEAEDEDGDIEEPDEVESLMSGFVDERFS